jgi:ADP-heptose:LPS heptosyltransferase
VLREYRLDIGQRTDPSGRDLGTFADMPRPGGVRAPDRLGHPKKILIIRALQLGDLLCIVPALRALRKRFPRATVTLTGLPWAREFVARFNGYVDRFIEFPGFPGLPEREFDWQRIPEFLRSIQARRFDLALQLHGDGRLLNPLTALFGARQCAGFYPSGGYCPDPDRFIAWRPDEHEITRYVRLMNELGVSSADTDLEFPIGDEDRREWTGIAQKYDIEDGRYVCVHPGAQLASRRWDPERFAAVGDEIAGDGLTVVLTGTVREQALTRRVATTMRYPAVDLAGVTSLGALAALIERARLVICNDTGISHVAAAVRTPSVIVCCGSDFRRWAPLDHERHHVLHHPVECRPCAYASCPIGHLCAAGVSAEWVAAEARCMLGSFYEPVEKKVCAR